LNGTTNRVNVGAGGLQANSTSNFPVISADGRWVAFNSFASNLVANDTNGQSDVIVYDRQTGVTSRASVGSGGSQLSHGFDRHRPGLSVDGRWVAFNAGRNSVFLHDRFTMTTIDASSGSPDGGGWPAISADGRHVAFTRSGAFVYDRLAGTTTRASVDSFGAPSSGLRQRK
jgi:Tol biopolymer transport system component